MSPTWNVMMVEIAIEVACGSSGCVWGSEWRISSTACPTSSESAASGATLSWREVPRNAYTIPGIAAENFGLRFVSCARGVGEAKDSPDPSLG